MPTVPDFVYKSDNRHKSVPETLCLCVTGDWSPAIQGIGSERNSSPTSLARQYKFEFSFVGNDRRPSQKSGTRRENRNAPDSPDLSPSIPDDRGYRRFRVLISRQNLGQSGNSKIPDGLGFSRYGSHHRHVLNQ